MCVARTDEERRLVFKSIGPVWNGNEVWLLAGGGTLYFAFPELYSSGFSGFYLPLMMVLWLLILRGISIEFRSHLETPVWRPFWDVVFCGASALLAIFFGAALGNVVRGVPVGVSQPFFLPSGPAGPPMANPASSTGTRCWSVWRRSRPWSTTARSGWSTRTRVRSASARVRVFRFSWPAVAALTVVITAVSFRVQPHLAQSFAERPWGYIFPLLALAGLLGMRFAARARQNLPPSCSLPSTSSAC